MTLMKMDTDEHGFYRSKLRKQRGTDRQKNGGRKILVERINPEYAEGVQTQIKKK